MGDRRSLYAPLGPGKEETEAMNADEMFQVAVEIKKECGPHPELEVLVDEVANAYRRALEAEKAGLQGRAEQGARPEATPTSRQ